MLAFARWTNRSPGITFSGFVLSLATTAAVHFGDIADPNTGEREEPNLRAAAQMIELIAMLQEQDQGQPDRARRAARRRSAVRAAPALRPGAAGREAHHRTVSLKITFLGTGTSHGVPMIGCDCATCRSTIPRDRRLRPSVFVETDDGAALLVDAGPDLRAQALTHGIRRVDAILFTHGHADHILGLDDVRRFNALQRRPMACYGDARTLDDIRRMFGYVFDPATPRGGGLPQLELVRDRRARSASAARRSCRCRSCTASGRFSGLRLGRFAYLTDCSAHPGRVVAAARGPRRARARRAARAAASRRISR